MKANAALRATALLCCGLGAPWTAGAQTKPVPDTMAQRALACTACHGEQGRVTPEGYVPRIAGKPAGYLERQLRAFRDGRRSNEGMSRLLQNLTDDVLRELSAHFEGLDPPDGAGPDRSPRTTPSAAAQQRARALVRDGDAALGLPACSACHGPGLTGSRPDVPALVGLPRDYLVAQLGAWRHGLRKAAEPDCMARIAKALAPQDIPAVADWLAAQPVPPRMTPSPERPARWPVDCGSVTR